MDNNEVVYLYLDDIIPNRFQPREVFDDQALKELAVSIREHGVIQPIIVRKVENKYEIIAGERRYKASTMAGLTKIPAIVKNLDDKESSKVALIENLQRKDLSPIEEARTYQKILELEDEMTQEQLAATLGKTQSSVSNKLRLLALPEEVQDALLKEKISERHARTLLNIEDKNDQIKMMDKVIAEKMTVRELEKEIKDSQEGKTPIEKEPQEIPSVTPETTNFELEKKEESGAINNNMNDKNIESNNIVQETSSTLINNPTVVDINKIRENSVDINKNNNLIGNNLLNNNVTPQEEPKNEEFKFVPSFDLPNKELNNAIEEAPTNIVNMFSTNLNNNKEQGNSDNSSIASAMSPIGLSIQSNQQINNVSEAAKDIKNTIDNLNNKGFNVTYEENDLENSYKITIEIRKN